MNIDYLSLKCLLVLYFHSSDSILIFFSTMSCRCEQLFDFIKTIWCRKMWILEDGVWDQSFPLALITLIMIHLQCFSALCHLNTSCKHLLIFLDLFFLFSTSTLLVRYLIVKAFFLFFFINHYSVVFFKINFAVFWSFNIWHDFRYQRLVPGRENIAAEHLVPQLGYVATSKIFFFII